jgi:hypothetical protein
MREISFKLGVFIDLDPLSPMARFFKQLKKTVDLQCENYKNQR